MKTTRTPIIATLAASAMLLLGGCASGAAEAPSGSAAGDCDALRSEMRDINNGAQNTLAGDLSASQADAEDYFGALDDRVDALEDSWKSDDAVSAALADFSDALDAADGYIESVPTDGSDPDADALATVQTGIQDAATAVTGACSEKK